MVRAILAGRKTMTRRVVKPQPLRNSYCNDFVSEHGDCVMYLGNPCILKESNGRNEKATGRLYAHPIKCPYGVPGDRLWVREGFGIGTPPTPFGETRVVYRADKQGWSVAANFWRPSIYMPRSTSRITLEIVSEKVERVQDIMPADIRAEGVEFDTTAEAFERWAALWNLINGKPKPVYDGKVIAHYVSYPWENIQETRTHRGKPLYVMGNPFVWVIESGVMK